MKNSLADEKTMDATVRNLEIVGEAAKKIDESIRNGYPNIEWKKLIGLRNVIIHDYFGVDYNIIWFIITKEIKPLERKLIDLKNEEK